MSRDYKRGPWVRRPNYLAMGLPGLSTHYRPASSGETSFGRGACGADAPADRLTSDPTQVACWRCVKTKAFDAAASRPEDP